MTGKVAIKGRLVTGMVVNVILLVGITWVVVLGTAGLVVAGRSVGKVVGLVVAGCGVVGVVSGLMVGGVVNMGLVVVPGLLVVVVRRMVGLLVSLVEVGGLVGRVVGLLLEGLEGLPLVGWIELGLPWVGEEDRVDNLGGLVVILGGLLVCLNGVEGVVKKSDFMVGVAGNLVVL